MEGKERLIRTPINRQIQGDHPPMLQAKALISVKKNILPLKTKAGTIFDPRNTIIIGDRNPPGVVRPLMPEVVANNSTTVLKKTLINPWTLEIDEWIRVSRKILPEAWGEVGVAEDEGEENNHLCLVI